MTMLVLGMFEKELGRMFNRSGMSRDSEWFNFKNGVNLIPFSGVTNG